MSTKEVYSNSAYLCSLLFYNFPLLIFYGTMITIKIKQKM